MEHIKVVSLNPLGGEKGRLIALEQHTAVLPFELKRIYYIYAVHEGERRGFHAHKKLKQLMICVSGSCDITVDDGTARVIHRMDRPDLALYIGQPVWRELSNFSEDCVLLVCASELYDPEDYIFNREEFIAYLESGR